MHKNEFFLATMPIDVVGLKQRLLNHSCGGFVSFEGWVRNHNENRSVGGLFYQAYESLAIHTGQEIVQQALNLFEIEQALCVHRTGTLQIGDMAVWIGVVGAHRQACFAACSYLIDRIKAEVPIWKQEYYLDDDPPSWLANKESLGDETFYRNEQSK